MPLITCPSCGEDTFTISGWADLDHCAYCGRPLALQRVELNSTLREKRRLAARRIPARSPATSPHDPRRGRG